MNSIILRLHMNLDVFLSLTPPLLIPNLVFPFRLFLGGTLAELLPKLVRFRRVFIQNASNLAGFSMIFLQFQHLNSKKLQPMKNSH